MLTVKDYRPTPFQSSEWEIVGERIESLSFLPLELDMIVTATADVDPMFDEFDEKPRRLSEGKKWRAGENAIEEEKVADNAIDEAKLQAMLAESFEAGRIAGAHEGRSSALEEAGEKLEAIGHSFERLAQEISAKIDTHFARVEKEAVQLALQVARRILATTAEVKPDYIISVIWDGLKCLGAAKPLKIKMSPQDYEFFEVVGFPAEISAEELGVAYLSDESIKSGCIIETNFGIVNLELDEMWEQVKEQLFEAYR